MNFYKNFTKKQVLTIVGKIILSSITMYAVYLGEWLAITPTMYMLLDVGFMLGKESQK